jgi:glycosyltransferase involved in cell wall biosynthesis
MKICLVTTFPPSTGGLSEYGFHIARELRRNPFLDLTVLADQLPEVHSEPEGFNVLRCWSFDDPATVFRLLKAIRKTKPDVVWFNLLFSTFGRKPVVAFSGLMAPLLARLTGRYTHVTLHHLMDTVELKDVGVRHETLYRVAGTVATRMILLSNSVSVLMPGYRKILNDKYGRDNVHLRAHGLLARRPEFPDFSRRGNSTHRILAFGKWGTYKRLELMIDAFKLISDRMPDTKLVVAGGDHPQAPGYIESMKRQHSTNSRIEFRGYVPESELADLFQSSTVAVMPYSSSTGCSGVAHLACAFGVPIVSADLPDFRQMGQSEELAIDFYPPGDAHGLADCLSDLLDNLDKQVSMATQNFSAALRMTMPNVVQKYLRHFELQQRVQTLRHISRFRRLPRWIPSKSLLLRLMTHNSLSWARRSVVLHTPMTDISPATLLDGHKDALLNHRNNGNGKTYGPGLSPDGHDTALPGQSSNGNGASARHSPQNHNGNGHNGNGKAKDFHNDGALEFTDHEEAANSKAQETLGDEEGAPFFVIGGGPSRDASERENRMPRSISKNDGVGTE